MKKILSFTLAVVLSLSLLVGSAFASSGVGSYFTPDTFISWGDTNNPYTLSVPSVAISGRNFIVYQVRDWTLSYLRVRFVIDSFDSEIVPVEGESVSGWIRYSGTWALGVNSALEPDYYSTSLFADDRYTFSKSFLHKPVYSNFDYYDSEGELIISGVTSGSADDSLMDLTLNDGSVIQVPRILVGNQFVVVRSVSDSSQYKIWNFGILDTLDGIYEGAVRVSYSTSVGSLAVGSPVVNGVTLDLSGSGIDFSVYPFVYAFKRDSLSYITVWASKTYPTFSRTPANGGYWVTLGANAQTNCYPSGSWDTSPSYYTGKASVGLPRHDMTQCAFNFDIEFDDGVSYAATFSLNGGGWFWSDWESSTAALSLTSYGDIVYQTFDYPLSNPDDDPSESPESSPSPGGTPDGSNNGFFAWLKIQWVFLMGKLDELIVAIKDLTFDLDPFPNQTKPILDDFFVHIFPDRVSSDDVSGIGSVLDKMGDWFDTGYGLSDLFGVFDDDDFISWFTDETQGALDSVGSGE